jgi:Secretion system C-terminal sorting domain
MKKKQAFIFTILFVVAINILLGQAPRKFYTKMGGAGIDVGYGVKQTLDKQYIITGSTSSFGQGNTDVYLIKLDSMGVILWQKTIGGFVNDVGRAIVQLSDSSYVITGFSNSFGNGGYDAYTVRTDKDGVIIWQRSWGGQDWDFAYDVLVAPDGNIVICGSTESFGNGKKDAFAVKYNYITGNQIWQKIIGGTEDDDFKGMVLDNSGTAIIAAGGTKSRGDILGDAWAFKLDLSSGDSLQRFMYGGNKADRANSVTVLATNHIVLAGNSESFSSGKKDAILFCLDANGQFVWEFHVGEATKDEDAFKVIKTNSMFSQTTFIGDTYQISGNKIDIMTYPASWGGYFVPGGLGGTFGFLEDDLVYDIAPTKDKGVVQVGYTNSFNALNSDLFFVKRDSTLNYGASLVGLSEQELIEKYLTVFPNPVNDILNLTLPAEIKSTIKAELLSIEGKQLQSYLLHSSNEKIDLSKYEPGIYFLKVYSKGFYKTVKIEKL